MSGGIRRVVAGAMSTLVVICGSSCVQGTATHPLESRPSATNGGTQRSPVPNSAAEASSTTTGAFPVVTAPPGTAPVPTFVDAAGFDDHTVPRVHSVEELLALARPGLDGQAVVKFAIPRLSDGTALLLDSNFFTLHDEWYWFRLLNGQPVPGSTIDPVEGNEFLTIAAIYQWASGHSGSLPLDLQWIDGRQSNRRLYSPAFYQLVLNAEPRTYGVGSLIRFPSRVAGGTDHWLMELEYSDQPTASEIVQFFRRLEATLPLEIASRLEWVIRSPEQEGLARLMESGGLPYHHRIVRYADLVPAGVTAVYSEGITAGRLLFVGDGGAQLGDSVADDILVVDGVPDWLPPASALISSAPQTALAHVNLLARNRGIPNASRSGVHLDPTIRQAARVRAPAIVRARGSGDLDILLISEDEYRQWQRRQSPTSVSVPVTDSSLIPLVVDLQVAADRVRSQADIDSWRPIIGGKSTGFLTLLVSDGVFTPPDPMAITIRPYRDHVAQFDDELSAILADPEFVRSPRARFLVLEGLEDYQLMFSSPDDAQYAARFVAEHPDDTAVGLVVAAGGFKAYFRDRPMDSGQLDEITATLSRQYREYDTVEGLRFRSSSTVEDIEGFNGAGLYDSNTGFLFPALQIDKSDQEQSVEFAVKKTWSSYWGFEAFEERRLQAIDHLSGAMAVTVHARSDDHLERNNGVATMTVLPAASPDQAVLLINAQPGAASVANPDPTILDLPEAIAVTKADDGALRIERLGRSSLSGGEQVFNDAAATELFGKVEAITEVWRLRSNRALPGEQQSSTIVLDLEFKTVRHGWPIVQDGTDAYGARLVIKQVRTLDPGLRNMSDELRQLPVPRDVLARARLIERVTCPTEAENEGAPSTTINIFTDPLIAPDVGYSTIPFAVVIDAQSGRETQFDREPTGCLTKELYSTPRQYLVDLLGAAGG